jgi:hypothetical protein
MEREAIMEELEELKDCFADLEGQYRAECALFGDAGPGQGVVAYLDNLSKKYDKRGRSDDAIILRFAAIAIRLRAERDVWKARAMEKIA